MAFSSFRAQREISSDIFEISPYGRNDGEVDSTNIHPLPLEGFGGVLFHVLI